MSPERFDLVVVGAGPCGIAAGAAARAAGLATVLFDRGCVTQSLIGYPYYMTYFSTAEKLEIAGVPFTIPDSKPTRREALAYYRLVAEHFSLRLRLYESVDSLRRDGSGFVAATQGADGRRALLRASSVVVATGYFGTPNLLGVPGEQLPHVSHLFREGHEAFGRDAVVVGGGNSAVESALELYRARARVTLVHFADGPDRNVKPWVLPDFENRVKDGSIGAMWSSRVLEILPGEMRVSTPDGERTIPAQHVYLMTGFTPSTTLLEGLGVTVDSSTGIPMHDPSTMETNVPGVFVAGVLTAGLDANKVFIENGRDHGDRIAAAISSRSSRRWTGDRLGTRDEGRGRSADASNP